MIRSLNPLDAPRQALLAEKRVSNRAYTFDALLGGSRPHLSLMDAARLSLWLKRRGACSFTETQNNRVVGIASARPRSGVRTWEISHLLLDAVDETPCIELLKQVYQEVARRGGERVFLRLLKDDPLVEVSRLCGFIRCTDEVLFKGRRKSDGGGPSTTLRTKRPSDDHDVFRLYNASTPAEVRSALGVTYSQWISSLERSRWRSREFVYEKDGALTGWLRVVQQFGASLLTVMVHPEHPASLPDLIDFGLARRHWSNTMYCLVQGYQESLQRLLDQMSYGVVSEYVTLARSMVAPVAKEQTRRAIRLARAGPGIELWERLEPGQEIGAYKAHWPAQNGKIIVISPSAADERFRVGRNNLLKAEVDS